MTLPMRWMTQPGSQTGKTQQEYKQAWDALGKTNQKLYGSKPNPNQWQGYYTGGSERQPSAYSAYSPGMAQPQQSPYANSTPYGQNGNLAYAPPDQRPPPFQQSWGNPFGAATSEPNFDWRNSLIGNVNSQLGQMQQQSWQQPGVLGAPQFNFNPMAQPPGMAQPVQDPYAASNAYGEAGVSGRREKPGLPRYPAHWYENKPAVYTRDMVPLPGGGQGSSTTASWIKENMELDRQRGLPEWQGRNGDAGQPGPMPPPQHASLPRQQTPQEWAEGVNFRLRNEFKERFGGFPPQDASATQVYIGEDGLAYVRRNPYGPPGQDKTPQLYKDQPPGAWPPVDPTAPVTEPRPPGRPSPGPFQDLFSQYNFTPPPGFMDDLIRRLQGGPQPGSLGPLPNAQPGFQPPETSQPPSEPTGPAPGSYEEYLQQHNSGGAFSGPAAGTLAKSRELYRGTRPLTEDHWRTVVRNSTPPTQEEREAEARRTQEIRRQQLAGSRALRQRTARRGGPSSVDFGVVAGEEEGATRDIDRRNNERRRRRDEAFRSRSRNQAQEMSLFQRLYPDMYAARMASGRPVM
jgi:hypothetical protein